MKLIIDIPEEVYEHGTLGLYFDCYSMRLHETILNGTPIPDNATNGDVVQMMFSNASFFYHKASDIVDDYVSVCIDDCDTQQDYSMVWWNEPYQKGGKE